MQKKGKCDICEYRKKSKYENFFYCERFKGNFSIYNNDVPICNYVPKALLSKQKGLMKFFK